MPSIALSIVLDSEFGVPHELDHEGSSLENPYVFDGVAKDLKAMAAEGRVEIVGERLSERGGERLIDRLAFVRRR